MGNLLPALLASPFLAVGLWLIWKDASIFGRGFAVLCGFPVALWIAVNFLGLYQNKRMRREMQQRLRAARPTVTSRRFFVGAATPKHTGYLDPHEDVGFLILHPERIDQDADGHSLDYSSFGQMARVLSFPQRSTLDTAKAFNSPSVACAVGRLSLDVVLGNTS